MRHPYSLYAVFVHVGAAVRLCAYVILCLFSFQFGGHYYSYVRDLSTNNWHKFDDQDVQLVDL